jgi:hypothetical protein
MEGSASVTGNIVSASGGGVYVNGGTFIMQDNASVTGNTVSTNSYTGSISGGGVYVTDGTFIMRGNAMVNDNEVSANNSMNATVSGGGVYVNSGTFTMEGGAISGNTVSVGNSGGISYGGGVCVNSGTFTMQSGAITGNTASGGSYGSAYGGGVYGNLTNGTTITMQNGAISGNTVSGYRIAFGGGLYGTLIMEDGAISNNTASATGSGSDVDAAGGGLCGTLTMKGGTISGNTVNAGSASGSTTVYARGGGVLGAFTMQGGTISGNTINAGNTVNINKVEAYGGGVYFTNTAFTKTSGTIYGNHEADDLRNTVIGGKGHAVYGFWNDNWRNATAGPTMNSDTYGFWLNETDITYSVVPNGSPTTSFIFTFSEDPGNVLASNITLSENVSRGNATVIGSGTTRTLSPITVNGTGIVTVSIPSMYKVETGYKNVFILPDTPTGVTTVASASTVTLNWNADPFATGYRVYRSTSTSGTYTRIATTSSTKYAEIRMPLNTTYFYRVSAYNNAGEGAQSDTVSATTLEDNTQRAIAVSSDTIVVEWPRDGTWNTVTRLFNLAQAPFGWIIGGGLSLETGYVIYRNGEYLDEIKVPTRLGVSLDPPFFLSPVQDSSTLNHYYVNTGLNPNTTYNYRVDIKSYLNFGDLGIIRENTEENVMRDSATTWSL